MKIKYLTAALLLASTTIYATKPQEQNKQQDIIEEYQKPIIHKIHFKDGQSLTGTILSQNETHLELKLGRGNILKIPRSDIESVEEEKKARFNQEGRFVHDNANASRYLWAPSAFMLKKGDFTFSQKQLFFSSLGYGVNDHVNVQIGGIIPLWLAQGDNYGFNLIFALKAGGEIKKNLNASVGFQNFVLPGFDSNIFLPFTNFTLGNSDKNFTLGIASPIPNTKTQYFGDLTLINFSGFIRLNDRFGLVSENHLLGLAFDESNENVFIGNIAGRIMWDQLSTDIGFFFIEDSTIPLPWLGVSYSW
jgi:hypothetical protein